MPRHQWSAEDIRRWRVLTAAVAAVLKQTADRGEPFKGAVAQIATGVTRTARAFFPCSDPQDWKTLAAYRNFATGYVHGGAALRPGKTAALQDLHNQVIAILDLGPAPAPPAARAAVALRWPYRDD